MMTITLYAALLFNPVEYPSQCIGHGIDMSSNKGTFDKMRVARKMDGCTCFGCFSF